MSVERSKAEKAVTADPWKTPRTMISPGISQSILESQPDLSSLRGKNVVITGGKNFIISYRPDDILTIQVPEV